MTSDPFIKLCRVVIHDDPDMLDAALVALHIEGHTGWRRGSYFGRSGVYHCIASEEINDVSWWDSGALAITNKFGCKTLGRQEAKYFVKEDANGVSV